MATVETMRVRAKGTKGDSPIIINKADFDPTKHEDLAALPQRQTRAQRKQPRHRIQATARRRKAA